MTLAGGALFGFWYALLLVSFASSIGATLACLVLAGSCCAIGCRGVFSVNSQAVNAGFERDGAFYLFSLRLVPVIPFFAINLVMGVLPISLLAFLLGQPAGHAGGHRGVRERRCAQLGALTDPWRYPVAGFDHLLPAAGGIFPWLARSLLDGSAAPPRAG